MIEGILVARGFTLWFWHSIMENTLFSRIRDGYLASANYVVQLDMLWDMSHEVNLCKNITSHEEMWIQKLQRDHWVT